MGIIEIVLNLVFLVLGVFLLVKCADLFVSGSSSIAKKMKISPLIIGLTVVSFGTSAPELAVSIVASLKVGAGGTADLTMGNVVGSNIMNLLVVLGVSAVICPMAIKKSLTRKEFPLLILSTLMLVLLAVDRVVGGVGAILRLEAILLMLFFTYFMYITIKSAKEETSEDQEVEEVVEHSNFKSIIFLIIGLVGIVVGSEFVTTPAQNIATDMALRIGLDASLVTTLVALTIVAIGTSLPELVTTVAAAKKGETEMALGNVIGSNIFNILLIVGCAGAITPLGVSTAVLIDLMVMAGSTILVFIFCITGYKLTRAKGALLLAVYALYLVYIILRTVM